MSPGSPIRSSVVIEGYDTTTTIFIRIAITITTTTTTIIIVVAIVIFVVFKCEQVVLVDVLFVVYEF